MVLMLVLPKQLTIGAVVATVLMGRHLEWWR